ncbi:GGDEF domain-containing protein [Cellulomonas hominis]
MAIALVLAAVLCLVGAVWPPSPQAPVGRWYAAAAVLVGGAALLVLTRWRRRVLHATLVGSVLVNGALVASCYSPQGVVTTSLGLLVSALFAAYAFTFRTVCAYLALNTTTLTAGMLLAPAGFAPATWVVLVVTLVVVTLLLGYVTQWLRWYATTDDLTGAMSRGAFLDRLDGELRRAARPGATLTIVSLDVDDFKIVNDTHGHQVGDEVLIQLVRHWRQALRPEDTVGRMGGDEFMVLLPGRSGDEAAAWALRLRDGSTVSWSVGIAQAEPGDSRRTLLERADAALYSSKAARPARTGGAGSR